MKTKKISVLAALVLAAAVVFLISCDPDGGGAGADFDAALYYTKTEIDAMIDSAVQEAVDAAEPVDDTSTALSLTGVDWAGRTGNFAVPSGGVERVLVEVIASNGSVDEKICYITFGSSETNGQVIAQFTLPGSDAGYKQFLGIATVPAGATVMYGWHETVHAGAAADLTGVSISIKPKLWLK